MTDAIVSDEVILRSCFRNVRDKIVEFCNGPISKENRLIVEAAVTNMVLAILFLIRSCQLMFFDNVIHVIINGRAPDDAILLSAIHGLLIDVVTFLVIGKEYAILQHFVEIGFTLLVNFRRVMIEIIRKIYFRFDDMIKGV